MTDLRTRIQTARFQDDVESWASLVGELLRQDVAEGMRAALSGMTRSGPGSAVKQRSVELIVDHLPAFAGIDLPNAVEAAISAAISARPDTDLRRRATSFIVDRSEALMRINFQLAVRCADFAVKWAAYDADLAQEAREVHDRLVAREDQLQQAVADTAKPEEPE
jgi:hypothetical protein